MGTAAYMSPEQARGKTLDKRTDIWSFGCCLFEALSGRAVCLGETVSDTIAKILEREPDWKALPRNTPPRLKELLARCLTKDAMHRLRDIGDARLALDGVFDEPRPSGSGVSSVRARWIGGALLAFGVIGGALWLLSERTRSSPTPVLQNPVQVTAAIGVEDYPSWSPDGRTLAYHSNQSGTWDIWVTQGGAGQLVNRTKRVSDDRYPSWSPDGTQIAFYSDRDGGDIFVIPALGGPARKLASATGRLTRVDWSEDGAESAFIRGYGLHIEQDIHIQFLRAGAERSVTIHTSGTAFDLAWSPNGDHFAFVRAPGSGIRSNMTQIAVLGLEGGETVPVTEGLANTWSPVWSDEGDALYFVTNRVGDRDLWMQPLGDAARPQGEPIRITTGIGMRSFDFSRDGRRFAYSKDGEVANVWRIPVFEDRRATWNDAEQITFEQSLIRQFDVSPDGERLVFASDRLGNEDLWMLSLEDGTVQTLVGDETHEAFWAPEYSPDGSSIAFISFRMGRRAVWVVPSAGGPARLAAEMDEDLYNPRWSPDGEFLAFNTFDIWVVPVSGGPPRQLTTTGEPRVNMNSDWSPDGREIVYPSTATGGTRLWRVSVNGGEPAPLNQGHALGPRWANDGRRIFFRRQDDIWILDLEDGSERPVTDFAGRRGALEKIELHGNTIYFTWRASLGDLWVMDVEQ